MRVAWLLLLAGCLEGSYYPSHEQWLFTTDDSGGSPTGELPCNRPDEGTTASLTVVNTVPEVFRLSVMDLNCQEQDVTTVGANATYQTTIGNHVVWVVRDDQDGFVRTFTLPSGTGVVWTEELP